jgi:hypothetical protein
VFLLLVDAELCPAFTLINIRYPFSLSDKGHLIITNKTYCFIRTNACATDCKKHSVVLVQEALVSIYIIHSGMSI